MSVRKPLAVMALTVIAVIALPPQARAQFNMVLTFSGLTPSQQTIFNNAKTTWSSYITGYMPGVSIPVLNISAMGTAIDGVGGVLGSAGPGAIVTQAGHTLPTSGSMNFDTADLANLESNGQLGSVVLHEMGHVMGFGTLWTNNNLYVNGSGHYTGPLALAAYRAQFIGQNLAPFIPVELGGGGGTADGHWNENNGGGSNTGIVDSLGTVHDMRYELMTGWLDAPTFISNMTIVSFGDLGYTTVPGPGPAALLGLAGALAARRRR